jgi:hypothetical protein
MSFANNLVSSALLVGALFSVTTFPLVAFSAKPVTVELERDTVFAGTLKDIAVPYLLTTAAISIGAGVANLAVMSWQQSSRRLTSLEGHMSTLTHQLSEKEAQLEYLKFSQSKLDTLGLAGFLQAGHEPTAQIGAAAYSNRLLPNASTVQAIESPAIAQVAISQPIFDSVPTQALPSSSANMRAVASFPAAQAFIGFARPKSLEPQIVPVDNELSTDSSATAPGLNLNNPDQVSELLTNLKQVMAQLEKLQPAETEQSQNTGSFPKLAS